MPNLSSLQTSVGIFTETFRYIKRGENPDESLSHLKMVWAREILTRLNVQVSVKGKVDDRSPLLFVGNHISYLDIPLLLSTAENVSFVAKEEISSWPVFGKAARLIDTIFVKRSCSHSRTAAREAVQEALQNSKRIVIFPSGTTGVSESKPWRRGIFEIAKSSGVKIQPFRINYDPLRPAAYIGKDFFPTHLYHLARQKKINADIEFHPSVEIENPEWDRIVWQYWTQLGFEQRPSVTQS